MEYVDIEEQAKREAYENVKKIADAIKKIRKKYYLCFSKISDIDKKRYEDLKKQMQNIANQNGLNKLSAELMEDLDIQFGDDDTNEIKKNKNPNKNSEEYLYEKYLAAIDFQAELIVLYKNSKDDETGKIYLEKVQEVQNYIKKLQKILEVSNNKEELNREKRKAFREKFGEQEKIYFKSLLKECYELTSKDPLAQSEASVNIQS